MKRISCYDLEGDIAEGVIFGGGGGVGVKPFCRKLLYEAGPGGGL